ncbi:hypothetical protein M8J77_025159 [Diaphorina citri]|nr:hypothetical protein M8J77_025159 [Diaphorina citri]
MRIKFHTSAGIEPTPTCLPGERLDHYATEAATPPSNSTLNATISYGSWINEVKQRSPWLVFRWVTIWAFKAIVWCWLLPDIAWLRVDTQTILSIQSHVVTKNHRIVVTHSDHRSWYLHIKETRETDRGWYMCQVNTEPMKNQVAYLEVVGK